MATFKQIVNRVWKYLQNFFHQRSLLTFCLFLLFATILWFGHAMNAVRERTVNIPITYTGVPKDIVFEHDLPEAFTITIRDQGKRLWDYQSTSLSAVQIDLSPYLTEDQGELVLYSEQLRTKLTDPLQGTAKLQSISPENIITAYYRQEEKTVPIRLAGTLKLAPQYQWVDTPMLADTLVTLYGPSSVLDTLQAVYTQPVSYTEVQDTLSATLSLVAPKGTRLTSKTVAFWATAEMYTEKKFVLPVEAHEVPTGLRLRFFPSTVEITVRVGVSHFAEVEASDIQAYCLFPTTEVPNLSVLWSCTNPFIRTVRVSPAQVEFIIEKEL